MSARRNILQRTVPQNQPNVRSAQQVVPDGPVDVKKMHPMMVISLHEERLNELTSRVEKLSSGMSSTTTTNKSANEDSALITECIKQIKFLTQENQMNRNLVRELTLELLRLKTSLQNEGKIEMHISEETQEEIKENSIVSETSNGADTVSFNGNGSYDPNSL